MSVRDELIRYYSNTSKHSNYQILPRSLKKILGGDEVQTRTRFEAERLKYILSKVTAQDKTILDIGGNTGFFTFELIDAGAQKVHYYEGNKEHVGFVTLATEALGLTDRVKVMHGYFSFDGKREGEYDIILLLNVLHHIGDDYGDKNLSITRAKQNIIEQLNSVAGQTDVLVFQLGFNWQGNREKCLFEKGTKQEMIDYIQNGTKDKWDIEAIGIAESTENGIEYTDLDDHNIERDDSLGEFLNRPLFILKSRRK